MSDVADHASGHVSVDTRYALLFDLSPLSTQVIAPDGRILRVNRAWEQLFGVTLDQLRDYRFFEDPQLAAQGVAPLLRRAFAGETVTVPPIPFVPDRGELAGRTMWVGALAYPVTDAEGRVEEVVLVHQDVTARREAEERTRELEAERGFLAALLASLSDGIVAADRDGRLSLFNDAARALHGLPAEPLPPEEWARHYDLFRADGVTPLPTEEIPLFRALNGERVRDAEMVVRPREAAPRSLLASGDAIVAPDGRRLGAVDAMRDVTERRRAEADLRRALAELEARNAEQEAFAYTVSHDLRAPLLAIHGMGELLGAAVRAGHAAEAEFLLGRVNANVERMGRLLNDVLALSRVGRTEVASEPRDLGDAVSEALAELEPHLRARGVRVELPPGWPTVVYPATELAQVVGNLLSNAVKWAGGAGKAPTVRVSWEPGGEFVVLRVDDDGPGVPPQHRERVFGLFQRLDAKAEGTGVGLAIVKRIAERHGGGVHVEDSDLGGARFAVRLPVAT